MERRTMLAIGLSMLVMLAFFRYVESTNPPPEPELPPTVSESREDVLPAPVVEPIIGSLQAPPVSVLESPLAGIIQDAPGLADEFVALETVVVQTGLIRVELSNAGGNIVSFQLLQHLDGRGPVEMIFAGDAEPQAFALAFGSWEDIVARRVQPLNRNFHVRRVSPLIVEFYQSFAVATGGHFTMLKRYEFKEDEYMFDLTVAMDGGHSVSSFDFHGAAYTLIFSPQIGPYFERLDQRYEYRNYYSYRGRLRNERVNEREPTVIGSNPSWAAIAGKYFTLVALPYVNQFDLVFSAQSESGIPSASRLFITRPPSGSSRIEDRYLFYLGPKNQETLSTYERGDNAFRLRETGLVEIANTRGFLAPLENLLKWFLMLFHGLIPNYGVAIILLTILVKLVLFPLTKKSSEATLRMQALAPKIKEIQEKHKGNTQKMNAEMAEFYKREGYNPLSGCLPMLLQLPIFFAMFSLFNNHFDLRGAMFIPGWIPDLSLPEYIFLFPEGVRIPLLGWNAFRLLPFLYVGSQMLYSKFTITPAQQSNPQMKMMLYVLPVVFFFVLYDMPSGLLIYWIMSNLLTMVQQIGLNKYMERKKAAIEAAEPKPAAAAPTVPKNVPKSVPKSVPKKKKKK
ncbi:MAG: membrane protein insertase YidC [Treponema sp.]|nr:membrane protein insertase YidC [Treponema sp.]